MMMGAFSPVTVTLLMLLQALPASALSPEDAVISQGLFTDTDGNPVHAHGLGLYEEDGTYYMFGTTIKKQPGWLSEGINCYSSQDLQNWKFESEVFHNTSIKVSFPGPYRIERPKVIYNAQTKKYVMWWHLDNAGFKFGWVGVATSDTLTGEYEFQRGFAPDGQRSLDMTLFQDDDGAAYLARSVDNKVLGISQLSDDFMNTTGIVSSLTEVEGQCIWKNDGRYWLLGSHLTGWSANAAVLSYTDATSLHGAKWISVGNPSNSSTTYNSQSTYVQMITHPNGDRLAIYMGDRWNEKGPGSVGNASYIWLPMVYDSSAKHYSMPYYDSWKIADF